MNKLITVFFSILICNSFIKAQSEPFKKVAIIDINFYHDFRNHKTLTYNLFGKLSPRVEYFSLTNYDSQNGSRDLANHYAEHNVRWKIHEDKSLDLFSQYVLRAGDLNDHLRLGLRWRLNDSKNINQFFKKINLKYSIGPMFLQFDLYQEIDYLTIIEHVYQLKISPKVFKNRLSLSGFADQNIRYLESNKVKFNWVSEHQLGYQFWDQLFVIAEYRINDFLPFDNYGLAIGLEYKIKL
jgi:hypothetical protein